MDNKLDLSGKNVLVLGYAMTGKSALEFLLAKGAKVTINDRGDLSSDPSVTSFLNRGVQVVDGGHPLSLLDQKFDFIVKNPGIPYHIPFLQAAIEKGIPIYTDVELAYWYCQATIIGITGSNGKTTTTSLIHRLLQAQPKGHAYLAGNIGIPVLNVVDEVQATDKLVMEMSSFQLMGTQNFKPHMAVICNIYSAHLDYHGSRDEYVKAKLRLIQNQTAEDFLVYNHALPELVSLVDQHPAIKIPFAIDLAPELQGQGAYVDGDAICFKAEKIANVSDIQLPGTHNIENVLAAVAIAKLNDVSNQDIVATLRAYNGMPHRNQNIAESCGRTFFNDSKATNIIASQTALSSFKNQPVVYIGGGLDRGNEFDELVPFLGQVKAAFLYGQTKEKMKKAMLAAGVQRIELVDQLPQACQLAYHYAQAGDVVLFSPACASWDQFKDFEERGDEFTRTIQTFIQEDPYQN
ncbi:UDP-N-acetylmuramoyl-L-alanine--D-glutamate ligase [Vaginisenegalia massiliensis]|uniref:UDP-N-acetylmuramoyl-L-alanine--D-glutamate ligase n=1 Tax=Vaginisenegalia massiliensis TaxID=2058294 RepID=UPI000F54B5C0|nr:UDP-N-acetylmuramoyl-L-alanine--D-glutamate ligase [Vaginisenegalia massiliensis]